MESLINRKFNRLISQYPTKLTPGSTAIVEIEFAEFKKHLQETFEKVDFWRVEPDFWPVIGLSMNNRKQLEKTGVFVLIKIEHLGKIEFKPYAAAHSEVADIPSAFPSVEKNESV
jgi:hypothetical protein